MSQDPQGRSPSSPEWESMGWDSFPDSSQDLQKTEQRGRGKGKEDEIAKGREERPGLPVQVYVWRGAKAPWATTSGLGRSGE